jgi:signal transduction histidine kinase
MVMKLNSLAVRLFATAAVWAVLVLPLAGLIIDFTHRREVERSFDERCRQLLTVIFAFSTEDQSEPPPRIPRNPGEPLFEVFHSGWYWQITPLGNSPGKRLVSASLASDELVMPSSTGIKPDPNNIRWLEAKGPAGEPLRVAETVNPVGDSEEPRLYSYVVAFNTEFAEHRILIFRQPLVISLALAGFGLALSTFMQVRFGLRPLRAIEKRLSAIRSGDAVVLEGNPPAEIAPLQIEINALIQSNQDIIERARTQVGNLAHALKTPLAVITNEVRDEATPASRKVAEQADLMRDQVNYYLDRARISARIGVIGRVTEARPAAEAIFRTLERIYRDRGLDLQLDCPVDVRFQGEKQDLEEMLGNLADNACKWATSKVVIAITTASDPSAKLARRLVITVDDDGPGLTPQERAQGIQRGRRLDESKPGSGLGHSIVADLVQSYRGQFRLEESRLGGLCARLELPAA